MVIGVNWVITKRWLSSDASVNKICGRSFWGCLWNSATNSTSVWVSLSWVCLEGPGAVANVEDGEAEVADEAGESGWFFGCFFTRTNSPPPLGDGYSLFLGFRSRSQRGISGKSVTLIKLGPHWPITGSLARKRSFMSVLYTNPRITFLSSSVMNSEMFLKMSWLL